MRVNMIDNGQASNHAPCLNFVLVNRPEYIRHIYVPINELREV